MKFLSKRIKVTLFVAVTVLFALTLLLMNSSKVYCATNTAKSIVDLASRGFFSDAAALNEPETSERIFDSDNSYEQENFGEANWRYPDSTYRGGMDIRNQESFFLYGLDNGGKEIKLKPINSETYWTNYNAENFVYVRAEQKLNFPGNVKPNDDAMTLDSSRLYNYYKNSDDHTRINTGIILYRYSERSEYLWDTTWEHVPLENNSSFYVKAPAFVEIAVLYELREIKGISSHYSHCVARYCLWVTKR